MSSGAAVRRAGLLSGTVGAVAACTAALLLAPGALAAPYPPAEPCVVTAAQSAQRANVPQPGVVDVDVRGAGAGAGDVVSLTSSGRTLARVRADEQGGFAAVLTAPARPDGATPVVTAVTARERCVSNPSPGSPGDGDPANGGPGGTNGPDGPDGPGGAGGPGGPGSAGDGTAGAGEPGSTAPGRGGASTGPSGPLSTDIAGTTGAAAPSSPTTSATSESSSSNPTAGSTSAAPPRADAPRISAPSLGIGLAIAAALLVLGTLAVLLLTRRPEH